MSDDRIIAALDVRTLDEVKALVTSLGDAVSFYKVGMELFYAVGPAVIAYLKQQNKRVFLDLKLCDIPNTVAEGLVSLLKWQPDILSVHAFGGYAMLHTAMERLKKASQEQNVPLPRVIAITVLTSMGDDDWQDLHIDQPIAAQVESLAQLAQRARLAGVVASPREAKKIRHLCGDDFLIVTPGVRPSGSALGDQKRTATPKEALLNGASHLVIGRPIYKAKNPRAAALDIARQIAQVKK